MKRSHRSVRLFCGFAAACVCGLAASAFAAGWTEITPPAQSGAFGTQVVVLPNGNFVVTDPGYSNTVGAVYLYDGQTLAIISTLTGSKAGNKVGSGGVTVLSNGNYVVNSPYWDSDTVSDLGAVTWCRATTGRSGQVSVTNSLVGLQEEDEIGWTGSTELPGVTALANGNYVVSSVNWHYYTSGAVGAVTWCDGTTGRVGQVTSANSLYGTLAGVAVGSGGVTVLANGNYVVSSPGWGDSEYTTSLGAVTWGSGTAGVKGAVGGNNSLCGATAGDGLGGHPNSTKKAVVGLPNGNYVVCCPTWQNVSGKTVGAVRWCDGTKTTGGGMSSADSLIGTSENDKIGYHGVTVLANGNYVVASAYWDNGTKTDAGALTWGSGTAGVAGYVCATNSLVGTNTYDYVGISIAALANGNYVACNYNWKNGTAAGAGAVTWCAGTVSVTGTISAANSLVGTGANDYVGNKGVKELANGNYVVISSNWSNTVTRAANAGAVTWCNGLTGITGAVNPDNSLVGSSSSDTLGYSKNGTANPAVVLPNGNYVVISPSWHNGSVASAGAATWCDGTVGATGEVSAANSLVGTQTYDNIGYGGVTALTNGNYVVISSVWDNGSTANAGAVTWGSGTQGVTGEVSAANSLVGSSASDQVGSGGVTALANGGYVVLSYMWNNGSVVYAGAATWCDGTTGIAGEVSAANSLVGGAAYDDVGTLISADADGNYVVSSHGTNSMSFGSGRGAATWCDGATGRIGSLENTGVDTWTGNVYNAYSEMSVTNGGPSPCLFALRSYASTYGTTHSRVAVYRSGGAAHADVTLTVASAYGTASPGAGSHTVAYESVLTNTVSSPVANGTTTQYVCTGWSMTGNEPLSGIGTTCEMTATNDAVLTWQWATQYWVTAASAAGHGSVSGLSSGWVTAGASVQLTADPDAYYHFAGWSGDVVSSDNPLALTVDGPVTLVATFEPDMTTTHPTPYWWLAQYGVTDNFEEAAEADSDGDGFCDWEEYIAGTDPTDADAKVVITACNVLYGTDYTERVYYREATNYVRWGETHEWPGGWVTQRVYQVEKFHFSWPSATGRVYDVLWRTNLLVGSWTILDGATNIPATPPVNTTTNSTPLVSSNGFFKVRVRLP